MRRGLLKDLANTPTQIACGWRLYGPDLPRLRNIGTDAVSIDLLTGECSVNGARLEPPLAIAAEVAVWLRERFDRDAVPPGLVHSATLILKPRPQAAPNLSIECSTEITTATDTYRSHDFAVWHAEDINDQ